MHEANHFLKRDSLKKILIQSLKYLFWWNPFAHLFANNFNHILEIQCDLETTADFTDDEKIRYLETITKIIKNPRANITKSVSVPNLLNLEDIDSLKQRFKIILNYKKKTSRLNMFNIGICSLALFIFASSYLIIIQPYYTPNDDEIYQEEETDNSFILERLNGSYDIYINNFLKYNIRNLDDLGKNLHGLPIYKEEEE